MTSNRTVSQQSAGVAAATIGCLLARFLSSPAPATADAARGGSRISLLGKAPTGYSVGRPSILATAKGVVLVAWRQYLQEPNRIKLVRRSGQKGFKSVSVPTGSLTTFGEPYLTEDLATDRILLTASGYADGVTQLGLYVWTSEDNGTSWSQPRMVWNSFSSGQIALDGEGGFYAITGQTGVSVTHVPADLTVQNWPADDVVLSYGTTSRAAVDLAATGKQHELLFAFASDAKPRQRAWVHIGTDPGSNHDRMLPVGELAPAADALQVAGDSKAAALAGIGLDQTASGTVQRLYVAGIGSTQPGGALKLLGLSVITSGAEFVSAFAISAVAGTGGQDTGRFVLAWLDDAGRLRMSGSISLKKAKWSQPKTVFKFPSQSYQNPDSLDLDGEWFSLHARNKKLSEAEIALSR